jgi:phytoene/squalene synthetase
MAALYAAGRDVCRSGPVRKYAKAAADLAKPSAAARALFGGARHIERVDRLIRQIAIQQGLRFDPLLNMVALIDERLGKNRSVADRRASLAEPASIRSRISQPISS